MFDIQYDEYGNLRSIKIAGKYITSENLTQYLSMFTARSFSANGNYLESLTDENGQAQWSYTGTGAGLVGFVAMCTK